MRGAPGHGARARTDGLGAGRAPPERGVAQTAPNERCSADWDVRGAFHG